MRKYHHIGIPVEKIEYKKIYYPNLKGFATPFEDSEFGVEHVHFLEDSPLPDEIKNQVHIAFEIDSFEEELAGHNVIVPPNSPEPGIEHAFILHRGVPVEFIKFTEKDNHEKNN